MSLVKDELGLARILLFVYGYLLMNLTEKIKDSNTSFKILHALTQVFYSFDVTIFIRMAAEEYIQSSLVLCM
jgi:hypothetical protein